MRCFLVSSGKVGTVDGALDGNMSFPKAMKIVVVVISDGEVMGAGDSS